MKPSSLIRPPRWRTAREDAADGTRRAACSSPSRHASGRCRGSRDHRTDRRHDDETDLHPPRCGTPRRRTSAVLSDNDETFGMHDMLLACRRAVLGVELDPLDPVLVHEHFCALVKQDGIHPAEVHPDGIVQLDVTLCKRLIAAIEWRHFWYPPFDGNLHHAGSGPHSHLEGRSLPGNKYVVRQTALLLRGVADLRRTVAMFGCPITGNLHSLVDIFRSHFEATDDFVGHDDHHEDGNDSVHLHQNSDSSASPPQRWQR